MRVASSIILFHDIDLVHSSDNPLSVQVVACLKFNVEHGTVLVLVKLLKNCGCVAVALRFL